MASYEPKTKKELEDIEKAFKEMPDLVNKDALINLLFKEVENWRKSYESLSDRYNELSYQDPRYNR